MYDRYKVGDVVKLIAGAFENSEGVILDINRETGAVQIEIVMFGNKSVMEVDFSDIEKIDY